MAHLATKATEILATKITKNHKEKSFLCDLCVLCGVFLVFFVAPSAAGAQPPPPELTQPVNDFAGVIDSESAARMDGIIRSLQKASGGDVMVVATVDTFKPYGDIREYAVKMFENHGRGIGQKGKDNGLLILLAVQDRQVWVEVGYDLEEFVTDGYAGELSRKVMVPEFRRGDYGAGLLAGVSRIAGRIAERRNVTLEGAAPPGDEENHDDEVGFGATGIVVLILLLIVLNIIGRTRRRRGFWGGDSWSGWNSGVGPFGGGFGRGGGFGGGFGGFGGGGGFGGFGGGRSGGGGGGGSW